MVHDVSLLKTIIRLAVNNYCAPKSKYEGHLKSNGNGPLNAIVKPVHTCSCHISLTDFTLLNEVLYCTCCKSGADSEGGGGGGGGKSRGSFSPPLTYFISWEILDKFDKFGISYSHPFPVSILRKSISGRHRPVRVADGPMTARCRFM